MLNPFKRKRSSVEPPLTELPAELCSLAAAIVQPGKVTRYPLQDRKGNVRDYRVRVIDVDYSRNLAVIEYVDSEMWYWLDVPIFDQYPIIQSN